MHNQILNTPQQLGSFYSLLGKEYSPLQQCWRLPPILSARSARHSTKYKPRLVLSQPGLPLLQTHLLCATAHQTILHPSFRSSAMAGFKAFLLFFVPLAQRSKQQD